MPNQPLHEFQTRFTQTLLTPLAPACFPEGILPGGRLASPDEALAIYADGYRVRLSEALGETFAAVWAVVGDKEFFRLAAHYIAREPSRSANLGDYGIGFPAFLTKSEVAKELPFLASLARFEWLFAEVFHAPRPGKGELDLDGMPLRGSSCLQFARSLRLLSSEYAVFEVWRQRNALGPNSFASVNEQQYLVLFKSSDERIWVQNLASWEFALLESLTSGVSIEAALGTICAQYEGITEDLVAKFFAKLRSNGMILALY